MDFPFVIIFRNPYWGCKILKITVSNIVRENVKGRRKKNDPFSFIGI